MTAAEVVPHLHRWTADEFVAAWDLGAFGDHRVELVDGEVWDVTPIGEWHGRATVELIRHLPDQGARLVAGTLPSGHRSAPDPDCWVRRAGATPVRALGQRLHEWAPDDILLVVEVSDTSLQADLTTKATVYAAAGYPVYWVVSPNGITVFTEPASTGYERRGEFEVGASVPVPYGDGVQIPVAVLVRPAD